MKLNLWKYDPWASLVPAYGGGKRDLFAEAEHEESRVVSRQVFGQIERDQNPGKNGTLPRQHLERGVLCDPSHQGTVV